MEVREEGMKVQEEIFLNSILFLLQVLFSNTRPIFVICSREVQIDKIAFGTYMFTIFFLPALPWIDENNFSETFIILFINFIQNL